VPSTNMTSKGFTSKSITYWQRMAGAATAGLNKARTCVATDSPLVLKNGSGSDDMRQHARAPGLVGNIYALGKRLIPRTAGNELCRRSKGSDHLRPLCNLGFLRRIFICVGREGISRASQAREANIVGVDKSAPKARQSQVQWMSRKLAQAEMFHVKHERRLSSIWLAMLTDIALQGSVCRM
jgi:hypothetical protein